MKITITFQDLDDGGCLITGDPSLEQLIERAQTPALLTSAEGYAAEAWIAIRKTAERCAQPGGGQQVAVWDDEGAKH